MSPEDQWLKTPGMYEWMNWSLLAAVSPMGCFSPGSPGSTGLQEVAEELARRWGVEAKEIKAGAYKMLIPSEVGPCQKKGILVRIMPAGSGDRPLPHFRVTIPNVAALDIEGIFSQDPVLTHFDFGLSDDVAEVLRRIEAIIRKFIERGGTGKG